VDAKDLKNHLTSLTQQFHNMGDGETKDGKIEFLPDETFTIQGKTKGNGTYKV